METKKCKHCQTDIPKNATKCPQCQSDLRPWPRRHPVWTVILGFLLLGIIISVANGGSKSSSTSVQPSTSDKTVNTTTQQTTIKPIIVDATTLVGEYDKNKLAAQDKYTNKLVQTTAFIDNISQDVLGSYFLSLHPTNDQYYAGTSMQCLFKDKSALTTLANGQQVTVMGTMQDMSLGIVEMKDCQLVK